MPKRKRLWKHQVPVVELLSVVNINAVHSNEDCGISGWVVLSSCELEQLVSAESHAESVLVRSGVRVAPFAERRPVGFPGAPRASGEQSASQLPEPSRASLREGIHPYLHRTQTVPSVHWQVSHARSPLRLCLPGSVHH